MDKQLQKQIGTTLKKITREELEKSLEKFRGAIEQTVPAFSAVKVQGKKLYELARKEKPIEALPSRLVTIKELELTEFETDDSEHKATFSLRVVCSSGTYIRSLVHDLGQELKVGATVTALRRTKIGELNVEEAISLI